MTLFPTITPSDWTRAIGYVPVNAVSAQLLLAVARMRLLRVLARRKGNA